MKNALCYKNQVLEKIDHMYHHLYKVELAGADIEHEEPLVVGFFKLQYAKLRMLELYYNFFTKFCHIEKLEKLEMDRESLYVAPAEKKNNQFFSTRDESRLGAIVFHKLWQKCRGWCFKKFSFLPQNCCAKRKKQDTREPGLFKEDFRFSEKLRFAVKLTAATIVPLISWKLAADVSISGYQNSVVIVFWRKIAPF